MVPNGWKLSTIEEIAHVSSGGTPSRKNDKYWNGNIPWVTTAEVQFKVIKDTTEKITEEGLANSSAKLFPVDTILMAMYGQGKTRGQVAKLGIEASTNQACAAIVLNPAYEVDYYYQFLVSQYENIREMANSGGQENLSGGIVKAIQVPVPPLPEQKKIAQILSTWDKAITTTEQLLANSQQQKKALMQQLLTGKKRLLDKNGVRFSGEWKVSKLSKLFARVTTKNNGQSTNVVTISGQHGLIRQEDFFKKTVASETLDGYFLLKQGQFAYNKSYSNGYPMGAIKRLNRYPDGVVTTLYICFELSDSGRADSDFWEHYFESGLLNKGLSQIAHEGGRAHGLLNVKPSDFFSLKVSTPSFEEQQKIAAVLSTADQEISALQQKLDALKQEKKALMQQLLTGKRRVVIE
ncbi:restriction endonuclease subunit S [Escherichia coli]|uniref:restriction endonuclease subunit S n=1 Tax=Escherichia coli TaxID=562 RepID=UPI0033582C79|nr:restriction endonuclease subunit S [Escherichia coli]